VRSVVTHPDTLSDVGRYRALGTRLVLENMDDRKFTGRVADEMEKFFEDLPDAGFCLDVAHVRAVDPTMDAAHELLDRFRARLRHVHLSTLDDGHHVPLTENDERLFAEVLNRCGDVPWILEALPPDRQGGADEDDSVRATSRGASQRTNVSPDRGVSGLEAATRQPFPHIMAARAKTNRRLRERRERFESVEADEDATVVLTGSWGRHEITGESDEDFMVVFEGSVRDGARLSVAQVARILGRRPPGVEDIFGEPVALEDLREKIGRDEDTNANLTRRMLFILESVAVCGADVHARARTSLIDGYRAVNVKYYRPLGSFSMTSFATGEQSRLISRARCGLGRAKAGVCATPSFACPVRLCSPADSCPCSAATAIPPRTCSTTWTSGCRFRHSTGSRMPSSITALPTRAFER
jgi:hypothetical protein